MSHLTILPTVLRDTDLLVAALDALQLHPKREGRVLGFAGEMEQVAVAIQLKDDLSLGWREEEDGTLALVADLERLSRFTALPALLAEITHAYAARLALQEASRYLSGATVNLVS